MSLEKDVKEIVLDLCKEDTLEKQLTYELIELLSIYPFSISPCMDKIISLINEDNSLIAIELADILFVNGTRILRIFFSRESFLCDWSKQIQIVWKFYPITKKLVFCLKKWSLISKKLPYCDLLLNISRKYDQYKLKGFICPQIIPGLIPSPKKENFRTYDEIYMEESFLLEVSFRDLIKEKKYEEANVIFKKLIYEEDFIEKTALYELNFFLNTKKEFVNMLDDISLNKKEKKDFCNETLSCLQDKCEETLKEIEKHLKTSAPENIKYSLFVLLTKIKKFLVSFDVKEGLEDDLIFF